jgi:hypothetical protein
MNVLIVPAALRELESAVRGYREIDPELGARFRFEFDRRVKWAVANPEVLRLRAGGYRRVNLAKFPYYVPYIIRMDTFWILACDHANREPEYWIERIPDAS